MPVISEGRSKSSDLPEQVNNQCHLGKEEPKERYHYPMTSADAARYFGDRLSALELKEITAYAELWYLGKKIEGSHCNPLAVHLSFCPSVSIDHIAYRYEVLGILGRGTFGKVFKCLDHKTKEIVAVKIIRDFRDCEEVPILNYLRKKDRNDSYNFVFMKAYFRFRKKLCIVFELLGPTLRNIKCSQKFSKGDVRRVAQDLVKFLTLLEKERIIHGDLKPGNIMLKTKREGIKVIDFGGSNFEQSFSGIHTLTYSSPEVLMKGHYTIATDMWSLGCILAELYTGQYLFPGADNHDQISLIKEALGRPPTETVMRKRIWNYFYNAKRKSRRTKSSPRTLQRILNTDDVQFLDFIKQCLNWDPEDRLTPTEAMKHPFLQNDCCTCIAKTTVLKQAS